MNPLPQAVLHCTRTNGCSCWNIKKSSSPPPPTTNTTWAELPCEAVLLDVALAPSQGIVLRQTQPRQSLIRACLARKENALAFDDLKRVAEHLELQIGTVTRKEALKHVLDVNSDGDESWAKHVMDLEGQCVDKATHLLVTDPMIEAAYEELADEDKSEFPEF